MSEVLCDHVEYIEALLHDNRQLRAQVAHMERELAAYRRSLHSMEAFHDTQ